VPCVVLFGAAAKIMPESEKVPLCNLTAGRLYHFLSVPVPLLYKTALIS